MGAGRDDQQSSDQQGNSEQGNSPEAEKRGELGDGSREEL